MKATFLLGIEFGYEDDEVECEVVGCTDVSEAMYAVILPSGWDKTMTWVESSGRAQVCSDWLIFKGNEADIPFIGK